MDNSFKNQIDPASSILILLPGNPHLDEAAAGLSLMLALKGKKSASISCPTQMTVDYSRLIGVDKITAEMGNKNLIVTFNNYPANDIERVSYDIENEQFKLSVIPKTGLNAPTRDQVVLNYAGVAADTAILVGGDKESDFPALTSPELKDIKKIHVGIRLLEGDGKTTIISLATASSSVSELIAYKIKEMGYTVDADMATNLLNGIENGSVSFQRKETNAQTFELMAELLKLGGQRLPKIDPKNYPQGAVPNQPYTQAPQQVYSEATAATQPAAAAVPQAANGEVQAEQMPIDQVPTDKNQEIVEAVVQGQDVPQSWTEPKVYTGTSMS